MRLLSICIIFIVLVSGCATGPQPSKIALDDKQGIKKIALLEVDELPEHLALSFSGAPALFGIIGGLVSADNQKKATETLTSLMKEQELAMGQLLTNKLEEVLVAKGYTVERLSGAREKTGYILTDFNKIEADADAVFDVIFTLAGYADRGIGKPYKPIVLVRAQVISMETRELIYSDVINYGYKLLNEKWVLIEPDEVVEFKDLEAITLSPSKARQGLTNAIEPIAAELTRNF